MKRLLCWFFYHVPVPLLSDDGHSLLTIKHQQYPATYHVYLCKYCKTLYYTETKEE